MNKRKGQAKLFGQEEEEEEESLGQEEEESLGQEEDESLGQEEEEESLGQKKKEEESLGQEKEEESLGQKEEEESLGQEEEHEHLVAGVAGVVGRSEGGVAVHSELTDGVATAQCILTTDGVDHLVIWRPHRREGLMTPLFASHETPGNHYKCEYYGTSPPTYSLKLRRCSSNMKPQVAIPTLGLDQSRRMPWEPITKS